MAFAGFGIPLVLALIGALWAPRAGAATVFMSGDVALDAGQLTPPRNRTPVLFVHGHDPSPDPQNPNYKKNFHHVLAGLTSFQQTLDLPANACLGIEPYYIHFGDTDADQRRSIDVDADEIEAAVNLILDRHRLAEPDNPGLKVAIIAYSKGTLSARKYLRRRVEAGSPAPVSEFIAIAPPNHGLRWLGLDFRPELLSAREMNNGYNYSCNPFNDASVDYVSNLNAALAGAPPGSTDGEAPGSRSNGEPVEAGVLYVTIYAAGNGDFVGGSTPQDDCDRNGVDMGRVLARNRAADAVNIDTIEIPAEPPSDAIPDFLAPFLTPETEAKFARHQNTVHHREVIFRALYAVAHHQAPDAGIAITGDVPEIPAPGAGPLLAAAVLLVDTSGSMGWSPEGAAGVEASGRRLTLAQQAAKPFLEMLQFFSPCRAGFGIARFPRQPFQGCLGEAPTPLAPARPDTVEAGKAAIDGLNPSGSTPLLAGIETAAGMFGSEPQKALVLLSDGFHNCPPGASIDAVGGAIAGLQAAGIRAYTIGFGQPAEVPHDILAALASETGGLYYDVTTAPGFDAAAWDPATALQATYKSILVDALDLASPADPAGVIAAGGRRTHSVTVTEADRKVAIYVSWAAPVKNRPGLVVTSSDGREVPWRTPQPGLSANEGDTHILVMLDAAFLRLPGRVSPAPWTLEIGFDGSGGEKALAYQYGVLSDSGLTLTPSVGPKAAATGAALTLTAALRRNGRPVSPPASVWVRVARPVEGIGNWISGERVSPEELGRVPAARGDETLSALMRKIIYLAEVRGRSYPGRISADRVRLYDDGTHGDPAAGDGVYTGVYAGANLPGTYAFEFNASGRTAEGFAFERNRRVEKHVAVKAERVAAQALRLPVEGGKPQLYEISVRPADGFGNLLGPGQGHKILWEAGQGRLLDPVTDHLDGRYSRPLELAPGTDPAAVGLTFVVGDSQFRLGLADALGSEAGTPIGWLLLLILLATAGIIWLLKA
jgi:hypothetical protein